MPRKRISIFFSVVFLLFIVTPTILIIVDETTDISVVFSSSEEEEEETGYEKNVDFQVLFPHLKSDNTYLVFNSTLNSLGYFDKKYTKPHLNIISPPPDFYIL